MILKRLLRQFFSRYEAQWETFMVVLAIAYVLIGFLPDFIELSPDTLDALDNLDTVITVFFVLEFGVRLLIAPSRKAYVRQHWMDVVALVPAVRWLRVTRVARILRLLRLARLKRVMCYLDRLEIDIAKFGRINGLQWVILALTLIMLALSVMFYYFEHPENPEVVNYWDALYGAMEIWATPGYGDIAPLTPAGRFIGLSLIISGLVTWGMLVASLASFLTQRRAEEDETDPAIMELQEKMARMPSLTSTELTALRGAVTALIDRELKNKGDS